MCHCARKTFQPAYSLLNHQSTFVLQSIDDVTTEHEKNTSYHRTICNGRHRENRAHNAVEHLCTDLWNIQQTNQILADKLTYHDGIIASQTRDAHVAREQAAANKSMLLQQVQDLRDVSVDVSRVIEEERAHVWGCAMATVEAIGMRANDTIAEADARVSQAVAAQEACHQRVAEMQQHAQLTAEWAQHAVSEVRSETIQAVLAAEMNLCSTLAQDTKDRSEAALRELEDRMQKALDKTDSRLSQARELASHHGCHGFTSW